MFTFHASDKPNNCLNIESVKDLGPSEEKLETKDETQRNKEPISSTLSEDEWGTLYFTPIFIREYLISYLSFMKPPKTIKSEKIAYSSYEGIKK